VWHKLTEQDKADLADAGAEAMRCYLAETLEDPLAGVVMRREIPVVVLRALARAGFIGSHAPPLRWDEELLEPAAWFQEADPILYDEAVRHARTELGTLLTAIRGELARSLFDIDDQAEISEDATDAEELEALRAWLLEKASEVEVLAQNALK
jgi:hypothetical protein